MGHLPSSQRSSYVFIISGEGACLSRHMCGRQWTTLGSPFLPSTFMWVMGTKLRSPGLPSKHLHPWSHLPSSLRWFFLENFIQSCKVTILKTQEQGLDETFNQDQPTDYKGMCRQRLGAPSFTGMAVWPPSSVAHAWSAIHVMIWPLQAAPHTTSGVCLFPAVNGFGYKWQGKTLPASPWRSWLWDLKKIQMQVCGRRCSAGVQKHHFSLPPVDFNCLLKCAFFFCKDSWVVRMADCPTCGYPTFSGYVTHTQNGSPQLLSMA